MTTAAFASSTELAKLGICPGRKRLERDFGSPIREIIIYCWALFVICGMTCLRPLCAGGISSEI
jgi:hypothetical protein